jgi:hypothetical protein
MIKLALVFIAAVAFIIIAGWLHALTGHGRYESKK